MNPTRKARLESTLKQELSQLCSREVKDPRVDPTVSVTEVRLSLDCKLAQIYVSTLGMTLGERPDENIEEKLKDSVKGLRSAAGHIKRQLARRLDLRVVPNLEFHADLGLAHSMRINELLQKVKDEDTQRGHTSK